MNPSCILATLLLVVAVALPAGAQDSHLPPRFDDPGRLERIRSALPGLDALYVAHAREHHLPGFAYGVVVDGQLIHRFTWGRARLEPDRPVGADTRFRIASMTKSFTAMAVLRLRDGGRLTLDDPVSLHVPEFSRVSPATRDAPPVTLRRLLRMDAGFPQDDPWADRRLDDTVAELEALVAGGLTFSNPPGVTWEYSNLAYALLGQVVSRVSGRPYQRYIAEEILAPLGMNSTVWDPAAVPADALALGYRWEQGRWRPEPLLGDGTFGAMGGLVTTLGDMARYAAFHLDAWPPRDDPDAGPVRRSTRREMHRPEAVIGLATDPPAPGLPPIPRFTGYNAGLSWNRDARGITWIRHSGGLPGYGSEYRFLPEHGIALIALANRTYAPMTTANTLAMEWLIEAARPPARTLPPSDILRRRQAQLVAILGDWNSADARDALAPNVFLDRDRPDWEAMSREALGKIGGIGTVGILTPENHLRGTFPIVGERGTLDVFFTLTPENPPRIQDIRLRVR